MTFKEILAQVIDWLQQDKRLSYRALKRQFALADDYLDDLKAELIEVRGMARDEDGQVLVWTGPAPATRTGVPGGPTVWTHLASLPPSLAGNRRTSHSALAAERKDVTVLFADLKGSMALLAGRDPEEARQLLDPVLERMMAAVHRYGGTVNQVLGDGIMALFGAPMAQADHAVRACYAALAMQEALRRYAAAVRCTHGITVQIRVGLSSGEVVVRAIGNDLHMDYTAIGQTTHLAARMEQLAHPGRTLLTAATLRLVEGRVQVRALGSRPVKGLAAPVEVFALVGAWTRRGRCPVRVAGGLRHGVGRAMAWTSARTPFPWGTQRSWALSEPRAPGRCSRWPRPGRGRSPPCSGTARRVPRLRACRVALPLRACSPVLRAHRQAADDMALCPPSSGGACPDRAPPRPRAGPAAGAAGVSGAGGAARTYHVNVLSARKNQSNEQPKNLTILHRGSPMKCMIPLLLAMLLVASVAHSQSGGAVGVSSMTIPQTTAVLVLQTPQQGVTPQHIMAVIPSEMRATVQRYLDGTIRQWYAHGDGKGIIVLVDAKTEDEARAVMETLPLAKEQWMDHAYIPVGPLMPLRALIGHCQVVGDNIVTRQQQALSGSNFHRPDA